MPKYTEDQIVEAVAKYVESWDMDTLVGYAQEQLTEYFLKSAYAEELHEFMGGQIND